MEELAPPSPNLPSTRNMGAGQYVGLGRPTPDTADRMFGTGLDSYVIATILRT